MTMTHGEAGVIPTACSPVEVTTRHPSNARIVSSPERDANSPYDFERTLYSTFFIGKSMPLSKEWVDNHTWYNSSSDMTGVLSVQGDFAKHIAAVTAAGGQATEVRTPEDLTNVDRLIIPGGESSTVGLLMQRFGLAEAVQKRASEGMPIWGTCMGMILLAKEVVGKPNQFTLGLLDITVQRNAFGAQVHSFEDKVQISGLLEPVLGVFIRAPIVTRVGEAVDVISRYSDKVVAVKSGKIFGTSFHPELTPDTRFHEMFLRV